LAFLFDSLLFLSRHAVAICLPSVCHLQDAGMATHDHTPQGRGYDTGLSYFHHSNDYYTEAGDGSMCHGAIDIWGTDAPASDFNTSWGRPDNQRNGTMEDYEEFKFMNAVLGIIQQHPKEQPLFLTYVREFTSPRSTATTAVLR